MSDTVEPSGLVQRVQELTDLELAMLLSFVAGQHCIITGEQDDLEPLEQELSLICSHVFALSYSVLHCSESTTLESFSDGILVESRPSDRLDNAEMRTNIDPGLSSQPLEGPAKRRSAGQKQPTHTENSKSQQDDRSIANVILITGISLASEKIQIQALELLRTKRIFTHTAVHTAPKTFLLVVITSGLEPRLNHHLRDHIFISHYHSQEDGFVNLEEASEWIEDERASVASDIGHIAELSANVTFTAEIRAYQQNIVIFLRLHRAVGGGISPRATQHLISLTKHLAAIHGQTYVSPSLVALAVRKIYPHRITIVQPEAERSVQYGSDLKAISALLKDYQPSQVIEEVLASVDIPV